MTQNIWKHWSFTKFYYSKPAATQLLHGLRVLCHVLIHLLGFYLVCCWHPGGDAQNGSLGRSAHHCTWSTGWVGGLHGTAAPRGLCWTVEKNTTKTIWKSNDIIHELQVHYSMRYIAPFPATWSVDWSGTYSAGGLLPCRCGQSLIVWSIN